MSDVFIPVAGDHPAFIALARGARRRVVTRLGAACLVAALATGLAGCAGPSVQDYAQQTPHLDLRDYFNGDLLAHGMFTDRSGHIVRRFTVKMTGRWTGDQGVLVEDFAYSDGKAEQRIWRIQRLADGRYQGRADDVVGVAEGESAGNTLRWRYVLRLPVDGRMVEVNFDDWMVQMDDKVMLNRAVMSKFGVNLGEVTLSFRKL